MIYGIYEKETEKLLALQENKPHLDKNQFIVKLTNAEVRNLTLPKP